MSYTSIAAQGGGRKVEEERGLKRRGNQRDGFWSRGEIGILGFHGCGRREEEEEIKEMDFGVEVKLGDWDFLGVV